MEGQRLQAAIYLAVSSLSEVEMQGSRVPGRRGYAVKAAIGPAGS